MKYISCDSLVLPKFTLADEAYRHYRNVEDNQKIQVV